MTLLSPNHNHAADECIAQIPQHHIPTQEEKVRASESFNKSVLVAAHMAALHDAYIMEMATHPVNEVNIKPASPTSSIGGLKTSTLKQLKIGKVHRRRVVNGTLCSKTLCTKTHSGLMVVNVLEDEEGNATPIYLSNGMEGNGGSAQAQRYYPQDSKVAVKEPYLTRLPDGEVVLLVEKMTDLVFLWVPDYVEENEGSKGSGEYKDGREVFAMEKKDGMPDDDTSEAPSGNVPVEEEEVEAKSSTASRELKFDNLSDNVKTEEAGKDQETDEVENVKIEEAEKDQETGEVENGRIEEDGIGQATGEVDNLKAEEDGKDQESAIGECEAEKDQETGDVENGRIEEDGKGQERGEVDNLKAEEDGKGQERGEVDNLKAEEDGKDQESAIVVEGVRDADEARKTIDVDGTDEKGGIDAEEKFVEVAKTDQASRDLSLEDMVSMHKSEDDSADANGVKAGEGEDAKATKKNGDESEGVAEKGESMQEDIYKQDTKQEKPVGDVDAGATAASLRIKGNALFARGEFNKAIDMYKRGAEKAQLDKLKKEEVLCLSNRAEVWLRLCRNRAALDDAEAALKILRELGDDDANKGDLALAKALFRKGRALMGLHKYEDAMRVLQEVLAKAPTDRQLREAAMKCRDRVQHVLKPGKRQRAAMNRKKSASFMMQ
ncbi:hypothetical protein L7F22_007730 [Adiantum nelumboides]|nr:hypothetical protein [Adiantum nelumboides]